MVSTTGCRILSGPPQAVERRVSQAASPGQGRSCLTRPRLTSAATACPGPAGPSADARCRGRSAPSNGARMATTGRTPCAPKLRPWPRRCDRPADRRGPWGCWRQPPSGQGAGGEARQLANTDGRLGVRRAVVVPRPGDPARRRQAAAHRANPLSRRRWRRHASPGASGRGPDRPPRRGLLRPGSVLALQVLQGPPSASRTRVARVAHCASAGARRRAGQAGSLMWGFLPARGCDCLERPVCQRDTVNEPSPPPACPRAAAPPVGPRSQFLHDCPSRPARA
jgi:hypothetical protein